MKIKRFFAKDMRTALTEVKDELGADAVIMSNKKVRGGIEIVAAVDYRERSKPASSTSLQDDAVNLSSSSNTSSLSARERPLTSEDTRNFADTLEKLLQRQEPKPLAEQFNRAPKAPELTRKTRSGSKQDNPALGEMHKELNLIRRLLEHQVSGLMWQEVERSEPVRALLIKALNKAGFSEPFADQLLALIPDGEGLVDTWGQVKALLTEHLHVGHDEILTQGGAIALLGATGVGKTTAIAKLAAHFTKRHGVDQVALVTTDHYRIGAHEQLQTYGRIIGCAVKQVRNADELSMALDQLKQRKLVLIDTAGIGQRDVRLTEQLETLSLNAKIQIRNYLVLPATSQRRVLEETFNQFHRVPISGCILTKLDESLTLGDALCVCIQHAIPISYITEGQRVPEDIQPAEAGVLIDRAIEMIERLEDGPYYWQGDGDDSAE